VDTFIEKLDADTMQEYLSTDGYYLEQRYFSSHGSLKMEKIDVFRPAIIAD